MKGIREYFGEIDIYLFDQILKNQFSKETVILDAGCGSGRNVVYFLRQGNQVYGVDQNSQAINYLRALAADLAPQLSSDNFKESRIESLPFAAEKFDLVISNAVLHFAEDEDHFNQMVSEMWRVLKSGGILFARLASTIGIEDKIELIENRRYYLPDGSERFLVDEEMLMQTTEIHGGVLGEPLKTTNVQNLRAMTTWIVRKK
jgi:tellurite methyltransferase